MQTFTLVSGLNPFSRRHVLMKCLIWIYKCFVFSCYLFMQNKIQRYGLIIFEIALFKTCAREIIIFFCFKLFHWDYIYDLQRSTPEILAVAPFPSFCILVQSHDFCAQSRKTVPHWPWPARTTPFLPSLGPHAKHTHTQLSLPESDRFPITFPSFYATQTDTLMIVPAELDYFMIHLSLLWLCFFPFAEKLSFRFFSASPLLLPPAAVGQDMTHDDDFMTYSRRTFVNDEERKTARRWRPKNKHDN